MSAMVVWLLTTTAGVLATLAALGPAGQQRAITCSAAMAYVALWALMQRADAALRDAGAIKRPQDGLGDFSTVA